MTPTDRALADWESGANVPRRPYGQQPPAPQSRSARPKPSPKSDGEFLSVEQAAAIIGVSKMTIYRAIEDKALKVYRIRHSFRIHEQDWADYLKSCMVKDDQ